VSGVSQKGRGNIIFEGEGEYGFWTDLDHCCEIKLSLLIESAK
jgi:hypothetical protein